MGQLKSKMLGEMTLRGFSDNTKRAYLSGCTKFAEYFNQSPEKLGTSEIKKYLLYLIEERKLSRSSIKIAYSGLKFLYNITMEKPFIIEGVPRVKTQKRLPVILPREKIVELITTIKNPKYRSIFQLMYSSGLRISETTNLYVTDIDSSRMLIRVRSGKGDKDRYVPLSNRALIDLRDYYLLFRTKLFLFEGRTSDKAISNRAIQHKLKKITKEFDIKDFTCHHFRHCFAVHSLEAGCDILEVKQLLGHSSLSSTSRYLQSRSQPELQSKNPFDLEI